MTVGSTIRKRFPDRVPILLGTEGEKQEKFLAPDTMSVREFNGLIRYRLTLPAEEALFLFIITKDGNSIVSSHATLLAQYEEHKKEDDCLHMRYCGENTFGGI